MATAVQRVKLTSEMSGWNTHGAKTAVGRRHLSWSPEWNPVLLFRKPNHQWQKRFSCNWKAVASPIARPSYDVPSRGDDVNQENGVTPRGKPGPVAPYGLRHGINDYTSWFANEPDMRGDSYGYDGPCPPWNDSLIHHYIFTLHAIDLPRLEMHGVVNGPSVRAALAGHVLAKAVLTGTYSLNLRLQPS